MTLGPLLTCEHAIFLVPARQYPVVDITVLRAYQSEVLWNSYLGGIDLIVPFLAD